jgi:hypothetical protein
MVTMWAGIGELIPESGQPGWEDLPLPVAPLTRNQAVIGANELFQIRVRLSFQWLLGTMTVAGLRTPRRATSGRY